MRRIWTVLTGSFVGSSVAVWLAAVGVHAQVEGEVNWWPYSWLWYLAAAALIAGVTWLVLIAGKVEPREEEVDVVKVFEDGLKDTPEEAEAKQAEQPLDTETYRFGDMTATPRRDGRLTVRFKSGQIVGVITPQDGRWHAEHVDMGDANWHDSAEDAMRAIWEAD